MRTTRTSRPPSTASRPGASGPGACSPATTLRLDRPTQDLRPKGGETSEIFAKNGPHGPVDGLGRTAGGARPGGSLRKFRQHKDGRDQRFVIVGVLVGE